MRHCLALLVVACGLISPARADYVEVRRAATIKAAADWAAEIYARPPIGDHLVLLAETQTNGYYYVRIPSSLDTSAQAGWIYRSLVRRFPGLPPGQANVSVAVTSNANLSDEPIGALDIYIFDVGQADSMLIVGPEPEQRTLLVDLGEPVGGSGGAPNYVHVAERIRQITGSSHLDYLMVSHYHQDHVGTARRGIAGLIETEDFTVGVLIDVGSEGEEYFDSRGTFNAFNENVLEWLQGAEPGVSERRSPSFGTADIDLGTGVSVDILTFAGRVHETDHGALAEAESRHPGLYDGSPASENDLSIGFELSYGDFELFSAGDLTGAEYPWGAGRPYHTKQGHGTYTNVESWMTDHWIAEGRESDVEVYRVNHHGSSHSTTPFLLDLLDPEFLIYSTSGGYGHPRAPVVARGAQTARQFATTTVASANAFLAQRGKVVGEVRIVVDSSGEWYWLNGELHAAYSDAHEGSGLHRGGAGDDVGGEDTHWIE